MTCTTKEEDEGYEENDVADDYNEEEMKYDVYDEDNDVNDSENYG